MANWRYHIKLGEVFNNDDLTFEQKRDEIVLRFREELKEHNETDEDITMLLDELEAIDDADEFDDVWDEVYDWADVNLVWIETF